MESIKSIRNGGVSNLYAMGNQSLSIKSIRNDKILGCRHLSTGRGSHVNNWLYGLVDGYSMKKPAEAGQGSVYRYVKNFCVTWHHHASKKNRNTALH